MIMRPKQFYLASVALLLIALSFPIQVMVLYGHHWSELNAILGKITWLNWMVIGSFLVGAYLYFHASRLILYLTPVILGLVAFNNYIVGKFSGDYSVAQTTFATVAMALVFLPLALPSSRMVLTDPKRRWWRRSKRFHKRVSTTLNPFVGDMIQAHTFDVSQTGAFVCFQDGQNTLPKVGDTLRVSFNVSSMKKIRCEAIVVRVTEAKGHYPKGIGIRFTDMGKWHEKHFEKLLQGNDLN